MKRLIILLLLLNSCGSPQKGTVVDLLTPDSLGVGASEGTLDGFGLGNKTMRNQEVPLELDFEGESKSTSVWLEWNLPAFPDNESLNKDRRRDRYMISINDSVSDLQELATYQMERDVEISDSHDTLVDAFLLDSDRKEQQLNLVADTLNAVNNSLRGIEGLVLYNTEKLGEVETLMNEPVVVTCLATPEPKEEAVIPPDTETPVKDVTPMKPPVLEQGKLSKWVGVIMGALFLFNAWVLIKMFTRQKETPKFIPASYVKDSLDWLNTDIINDEKKTDDI